MRRMEQNGACITLARSSLVRRLHCVPFLHQSDNFLIAGTRADVKEMTAQISSVFVVKVRGTLGPRHDDLKSIFLLNRVIRWLDGTTEKRECIEHDAVLRHREVLLVQLCLFSALGVNTPSEKVGVGDFTVAPLEDHAVHTFESAVVNLACRLWAVLMYNTKPRRWQLVARQNHLFVISAFCADVFAT